MTTEHVYKKFPNDIGVIRELLDEDATFREICDDYEEICTWLAGHCNSEVRSSNECYHALEVMRDLEDEILKVLKAKGF